MQGIYGVQCSNKRTMDPGTCEKVHTALYIEKSNDESAVDKFILAVQSRALASWICWFHKDSAKSVYSPHT